MKWSDDYATGVQTIDEQHKMIFKMAEDFRAALEEGKGEAVYPGLLHALNLYCRSHFNIEEQCMDEYRCPVAQKNREDHVRFLEVLSGFQQSYEESGFNSADARKLTVIIDEWLIDHILRIDIQLKQCVSK